MSLQFSPLLAPHDINRCEIRYHWVQEYYILRLQISLILFFSHETAKTKLALLSFLYCWEFVKTSIDPGLSACPGPIPVQWMCHLEWITVHEMFESL